MANLQKHEYYSNTEPTQRISRVAIAASSSGDNTIVAAVSGKIIRVYSVVLIVASAVTIRFESGASGTALTGQMPLTVGFAPPFNPWGHFQTAAGSLLNLELSGNVAVSGWLTYAEI